MSENSNWKTMACKYCRVPVSEDAECCPNCGMGGAVLTEEWTEYWERGSSSDMSGTYTHSEHCVQYRMTPSGIPGRIVKQIPEWARR